MNPSLAASESGTTIPSASQIVDSTGSVWTVVADTCYRNGIQAGGTVPGFNCSSISSMLWYQGNLYVTAQNGSWWEYNPAGPWWTQVGVPNANPGMVLDPSNWTLAVDQDFTFGNNPSLYSVFCGQQGAVGGAYDSNFSPNNLYWQNGVLILSLQSGSNTSCTGVDRPFAGAGFVLNIATPTSIAVEFEIKSSGVYGVAPYVGLVPSPIANYSCGWGLEDDFFEPDSEFPNQNYQTYHSWTPSPACTHLYDQIITTIPDIALTYHNYGVVRNSGTQFFIDGVLQKFSSGQKIETNNFLTLPIAVTMGVGSYTVAQPDPTQLPGYVYVRHIKVWYLNQ